jgi:hypothetical protein
VQRNCRWQSFWKRNIYREIHYCSTYCHVSQWLKTRFGFVIRFIDLLQVVTTINYNTVPDFHTTKHSTLLSSVYLHDFSRIYNTGTIKVSLNHTLPIPLHSGTRKVFTTHVKSSQADFLYSSVLRVAIRSELTGHGSRYIAAERTWTFGKHILRDRYPANLLARRSDLQKTQLPLLLHVELFLQSYCLATRW